MEPDQVVRSETHTEQEKSPSTLRCPARRSAYATPRATPQRANVAYTLHLGGGRRGRNPRNRRHTGLKRLLKKYRVPPLGAQGPTGTRQRRVGRFVEGIALRYVEANQRPSGAPAAPTRRGTGGCGPGSALGRFTDADPASPGARSLSAPRLARNRKTPSRWSLYFFNSLLGLKDQRAVSTRKA